jgi:hypothetical protein
VDNSGYLNRCETPETDLGLENERGRIIRGPKLAGQYLQILTY